MAKQDTEKEKTFEERQLELQERQIAFNERQLALQERQAAIAEASMRFQGEQLKQTAKKSNARAPEVSCYNPQGQKDYPMPALDCEVWMPFSQMPASHGFTFEEVELINLITASCEGNVTRNDGQVERVYCLVRQNRVNGKPERKDFTRGYDEEAKQNIPLFTNENKNAWPSIASIVRQLLGPEKTAHILTMEERERRVRLPEDHAERLPVSVGA